MCFQPLSTSLGQTLAAFQGRVRAHRSPARVITLAISAQAKGSKVPHRPGFQVEKVHHLLTAVTTSWESTGEAQSLKEPRRKGTSTQNTDSWPERSCACVSRQLLSSSPFITFFEHLKTSFSPGCSSTGFCGPGYSSTIREAATVGVALAEFREQNEGVLPILRLRP